MSAAPEKSPLATRFRGFLPVVVDVETGGFDPQRDALLQVAAVIIDIDSEGALFSRETISRHIEPFEGANLDPKSLEVNGIDPYHPLRIAIPERQALNEIFHPIRQAVKRHGCKRAILVGHNACFDLRFVNAAVERSGVKRCPFHPFSSFDTVTLGGLAYGQTVLARAVEASGTRWDAREAHSAIYDCERTADLFCTVVNYWGPPLDPADLEAEESGG